MDIAHKQVSHDVLRMSKESGFKVHIKGVLVHSDWPNYALLSCSVSQNRFLALMETMPKMCDRMLILGYKDYREACEAVFDAVDAVNKDKLKPLKIT